VIALLLLLGLGVGAGAAQAEQLVPQIRLSPDPAGMGEIVVLEIELENAPTDVFLDASFKLENLRQLSGPSSGTSLQIVNGRTSSSRTLRWRLTPKAAGPARVYDIEVQVGEQRLRGEAATIKVERLVPPDRQRQSASRDPFGGLLDDDPLDRFLRPRRPARRREPRIYLYAEAKPEHPWVGQQVIYTVYLFTQADVVSANPQETPDFQGFWVRDIPEPADRPAQVEMVDREDGRYGRVRLLRRALFPRRGGRFEIEPTRFALRARVPDEGPFGLFGARGADLERASNPVSLKVRPLPPPPPGFDGAVGTLRLDSDLKPAQLAVGDAATLTLTLSGSGNLQGIRKPQLEAPDGIKIFPPQQQAAEKVRGTRIVGTRTWRFVLVPERPGHWDLPPIAVPYFDPQSGDYQRATSDALSLDAQGATALTQEDGTTVRLHPIRTAALPAAQQGFGFGRLAPWLFAAPWLLSGVWLALARGVAAGPRSERRTLAVALRSAEGEDDPRRAATAIEEAWRAYLGTRFDLPAGMASSQWRRALAARGVADADAGALVELADDLHYLRYAPKLSSTEDLRRELITRSHKLIRHL